MNNVQQQQATKKKQMAHSKTSDPKQLSTLASNKSSNNFGNFTAASTGVGNPGQHPLQVNGPSKTQGPATLNGLGGPTMGNGLRQTSNINERWGQQLPGTTQSPTQLPDFNIDLQEYNYVFKVFDKNNSGEISINQVYETISKFDQQQEQDKIIQQPAQNINLKNAVSVEKKYEGYGQPTQPNYARATREQRGTQKNNVLFSNGQYMLGGKEFKGGGGNKETSPVKHQKSLHNGSVASSQHMRQNGLGGDKSPRRQSNLQAKELAQGHLNLKLNGISPQDEKERDPGSGGLKKIGSLKPGTAQIIEKEQQITEFPHGRSTLNFEEFIDLIKDSCTDNQNAENYLVLAFSMFDRQKQVIFIDKFRKGYISSEDLREVFEIMGESITEEEVNTMIKIAGVKSSDKINFKEFVDFFYKID